MKQITKDTKYDSFVELQMGTVYSLEHLLASSEGQPILFSEALNQM